ncbi:hypothetical protein [Agrobacterium tumefaciens]|uniref:hypothetical protein n=1 Tax=Agrobacterium tumefaciens TaxID=358 RepID=UPI001F167BA5
MSDSAFPYGNDLKTPDSWAGLAHTKSQSWLIGYDSGASLILGAHTFLLFGRENLCACVASFYGAGLSAGYGMSNAAKRVERGGGQSMRIGQGGGASEQLKTIEDMKTAKDISDIPTAGDQYDSAEKIYRFLAAQQNGMSALKPFCINDLDYTMGWVSGASVDAAIGVGTYYLADARNLFKGATALNVKTEATLVGASLGSMMGFWRVKKWYSLWNELSRSKREEYPFQAYNVHPYFREWKSEEYTYQKQLDRIAEQDRIINSITRDMQVNPAKYGFPDSGYALQRSVEMTEKFYSGARSLDSNPFMPWVPMDKQHIFYEGR